MLQSYRSGMPTYSRLWMCLSYTFTNITSLGKVQFKIFLISVAVRGLQNWRCRGTIVQFMEIQFLWKINCSMAHKKDKSFQVNHVSQLHNVGFTDRRPHKRSANPLVKIWQLHKVHIRWCTVVTSVELKIKDSPNHKLIINFRNSI